MDGLLVVDKPVGPTSHDIVARLRRRLRERRIGHTGTLDPGASGVLVLVVGRATRLAQFLSNDRKAYDAVVRLGVSTDTYDAQGHPVGSTFSGPFPSREVVEDVLRSFLGAIQQRPPAYSAKKIDGQRSYDLARRRAESGESPIVPGAASVSVERLTITSYSDDTLRLAVACSAGFYVRSLAHDLGERLETGGHLASLRRTASGDLTLAEAQPLDALEDSETAARAALVPMSGMLTTLPSVVLTADGVTLVEHGRPLAASVCERRADRDRVFGGALAPGQPVRLMAPTGELLGIGLPSRPGLLHPSVVLK